MSYLGALQKTLAAEDAALYVLAALGAQTSVSQQPALAEAIAEAYNAALARRDRLVARSTRLGADPVPGRAGYALGRKCGVRG